jgi:4-amino-4-deoxy-L-arabinose transferase-like glycosyltransferase
LLDKGGPMNVAPPKLRASLFQLRERIENAKLPRFAPEAALCVLVICYLGITALLCARQLWHDELFTYYIAKAPSLSRMFEEIRVDLNPPLMYLCSRLSLKLFGDSAYATRLPAILGFLTGSLCLYFFFKRRLRPAYGLLAMLIFWTAPFFSYATEARPYGLIIGFFGLTMLAWQSAAAPGRRTRAIVYVALAVTGMMLTHLFAMFYLAPFAFVELARLYWRRRPDFALWAAFAVPAVIPFVYVSLMSRYQAGFFPANFQASFRKIGIFYFQSLEPQGWIWLLAVCCALAIVYRRVQPKVDTRALITPLESVFVLGVSALPVVVNLALMRAHGAFFNRYALPTVFGYTIALVFFVAAFTNISRLAAVLAAAILFVYLPAANILVPVMVALKREQGASQPKSARSIENVQPSLPLVAASGLTFLEMDKYAPQTTVERLHYLMDPQYAVQYAHATIFEGMGLLKQYFPIRASVDGYRRFVQDHRQFLVLGTPDYPEDWLLRRLMDVGARLDYEGDFPGPYKDSQLFLVNMPESGDSGAAAMPGRP